MSNFGNAFSAARKAGKKTFTWNGKLYTTKLAATAKLPKHGPVPAARPDTSKATVKASASADTSTSSMAGASVKASTPTDGLSTEERQLKGIGKTIAKLAFPDVPKDDSINPDKYKGTPQAMRDMGDLSGPKYPPKSKYEAAMAKRNSLKIEKKKPILGALFSDK